MKKMKLDLPSEDLEILSDPMEAAYSACNQCGGGLPPPPYMPPGWIRNKQLVIPFDNYVKGGDQTLGEILSAVAAANGGKKPKVSQQVRDVNGKLIRVTLTLPKSAAAAAVSAINNNPGVVTIALPPTPLSPANQQLATLAGIVWTGAFTGNAQQILVEAIDPLDPEGRVVLMGTLTQAGYTQGTPVTPEYTLMRVTLTNGNLVTVSWLAVDVLTLTFEGPQPAATVVFQNDFTLHAIAQNPAGSTANLIAGLISEAGGFYPETHLVLGQLFVSSISYEQPFTRARL